MGLAVVLIIVGIVLWLLVNPIIGIVCLVIGLVLLAWAAFSFGGPAVGAPGYRRRRYWY